MFPAHQATREYYEYVAGGYDRMVDSYDRVEGANRISERVRRATLALATDLFRPGDRVIELGCGTGRDAVALAKRGVDVVATDVSPEMVNATRRRVSRERVEGRVQTMCLSAADAANLEGSFDGAYSNGAVLNLEPDLARFAEGLGRAVRPGGHAVLTAANRVSLFELLFYPAVLRPRKAFRKLRGTVPIPISREGFGKRYVVPTRFLTPREFYRVFHADFGIEVLRGLQAITPPWNLVDLAERLRVAIAPLERVEDSIGTWPGARSLGAICLFGLRRRPGGRT